MKRLYRSQSNRFLAGVCGGIGEYLELDPVVIRVVFVIFSMVGGTGLLLYVLLAIIIPDESKVIK